VSAAYGARSWCQAASPIAHDRIGKTTGKELTDLLSHVARGLNINWDEATRYAGLNAEF
jgi:hypothetical protein